MRLCGEAAQNCYGENVRVPLHPRVSSQITDEVCVMTRLFLTSLALALSILPSYGQDTLTTDRSGYTTGTVGGAIQNTYTDRYGNTTGWVGGKTLVLTATGTAGTPGTTPTTAAKHKNT